MIFFEQQSHQRNQQAKRELDQFSKLYPEWEQLKNIELVAGKESGLEAVLKEAETNVYNSVTGRIRG